MNLPVVIDLLIENRDLLITDKNVCISKKYLENLQSIDQLKAHLIKKPLPEIIDVLNF